MNKTCQQQFKWIIKGVILRAFSVFSIFYFTLPAPYRKLKFLVLGSFSKFACPVVSHAMYRTRVLILWFAVLLGIFAFSINSAHAEAPTAGLVGYWNFDEGSGAVANDTSDNGNNGTINPVIFPQSGTYITG